MKKIDEAIENYFAPEEKKPFGMSDLVEMINEEINALPLGKLIKETQSTTLTVDMIPEIPVSELGWSDVRTTDKGTQIAGPQRQALIDYLANIRGTDLQEKLASLNRFYEEGLKFPANIAPATKISKILSYLVFYKTLTAVIQNFNAASAGFSFESFLGALLKGQQVPTGEGTIADLIAGDGTPISLKLYSEKSLEVGGSWTDLVNDIVGAPGHMQYVVCMKSLTGQGLEQEGSIKWYRFNFDLDNVVAINAKASGTSQNSIQLPLAFIQNPGEADLNATLPERAKISAEELEAQFTEVIKSQIKDEQQAEALLQALDWANNTQIFASKGDRRPGRSPFLKKPVQAVVDDLISSEVFSADTRQDVLNLVVRANSAAIDYVKSAGERRLAALTDMEFASTEQSEEVYNGLPPELKKVALKNTRGYLYTDKFGLSKTDVINIAQSAASSPGNLFPAGQSQVFIGEIKIGQSFIQEMLDRVVAEINDSVFVIINNLKTLTANLNSYFGTGLKNDKSAISAITAADTIEGKTEELRATGPETVEGP